MQLNDIMVQLYSERQGKKYAQIIETRLSAFIEKNEVKTWPSLSEHNVILIAYADMLYKKTCPDDKSLPVLHDWLKEKVANFINILHILPFFPSSSDHGFAVIDYYRVAEEFGDWQDIAKLENDFDLGFDAVFNHISAQSKWLSDYLNDAHNCSDYFITKWHEDDCQNVIRPRTTPLFHNFTNKNGKEKSLWTTFSRDQVDLNYQSPALLLEVIEVFLFYLAQKARIIRLDAVGFLWKEKGTSCLHLPQAHLLVKLFRLIADKVAPGTIILTETNVPHQQNIEYFGANGDEAELIYQFPLPPLVAHAILAQNATHLANWLQSLVEPPQTCTFLNFLASHDGIGLRPLEGILPTSAIDLLVDTTLKNDGLVSYRTDSEENKIPYELNINYFSLLSDSDNNELSARKFMLSQALMLTLPGIPGIYLHSLLGSKNWLQGVKDSGEKRAINREKLAVENLEELLYDSGSQQSLIFSEYSQLLTLRKHCSSFHPKSGFKILQSKSETLIIKRGTRATFPELLAVFNFSDCAQQICLSQDELQHTTFRDLHGGDAFNATTIHIEPFHFRWLLATDKLV